MKVLIFLVALVPLLRLIYLGFTNDLSANPIEFITRSTGTWALVLLCVTLAMTPLRMLTGSSIWIRYRRMLGLFSFFYACIHFGIWIWLDLDFDLIEMWKDVVKRPFITMGFLSFVFMIPLALTSNHWAQKKLGRRWSFLHRSIYVMAGTVILHYWWHKVGKNDLQAVSIYAGTIIFLLTLRLPFIKQRFLRK
uniref:protein-methionine-sulfoxide reductase heme-binding subunit MsrQ n=1 Tax=Polynucleobacter sp. TaxID=2029855 RepID=UPI0040474180